MKKFLLILIISQFMSCNLFIKDIYSELPHNSKLTKKTLKKSKQIIVGKKYIILLYDTSKDQEIRENHLLFYDRKNLKLLHATYFASSFVNTFKNNELTAYFEYLKNTRKWKYRKDIPADIKIRYIQRNNIYAWETYSNSIIDKVKIKDITKLELDIRRCKERYYFSITDSSDVDLNIFKIKDTIIQPIMNFGFGYQNGGIGYINTRSKDKEIIDGYEISRKKFDDFYDTLYELLEKSN